MNSDRADADPRDADGVEDVDGQATSLFGDIAVVELGQYIAAPYAAELLAHGGADVISIEPVDGGPTRHGAPLGVEGDGDGRHYVVKSRGKRALQLQLASPEGLRIVGELVARADVVITNLRPGLAEALGIGWDRLRAERPDLIYAEVSAFGDEGPLADVAGVDLVVQAASGLLRSSGRRVEGKAAPTDVMIADYTAGSLLAFAIAAALRHRERTGLGQRVSTSLMAAAFTAQHRRAHRFERLDGWQDELVTRAAAPDADVDELMAWREDQTGSAPYFYNTYKVADGEVAIGAVAANGPRLLEVAGIDPAELDGRATLRGLTLGETCDLVAAMLSDQPADELVDRLRAVGVPAARVRFLEEALADPDVHAAGLLQRFEHPRVGQTVLPAPPVRFSGVSYTAGTDTPAYGAHTDEVLRDLGYDEATIDRLVADGIIARTD